MRIFIDIETAPTNDPELIREIESSITAPGNYTKPESIQQWMETKGEMAKREAIAKTALSPEDGSIISVCLATDDGEPVTFMRPPEEPDDARLLKQVYAYLDDVLTDASVSSNTTGDLLHRPNPWFIGHSVVGFDLPWLWKRSVIHGLSVPFTLYSPDELRHGRNCYDTMLGWAGLRGHITLSRLCRVLGITDPKANESGISGKNAFEFWQKGDLDTVDAYNRGDVLAVREIFHRMEAMRRAA